MTITNGQASIGGGIYHSGVLGNANLQVVNCTLSGNSTSFAGGAIVNEGVSGNASLEIINSRLSDNSTANVGGAIQNHSQLGSASVQIVNCTLSGNSATYGGSIYNSGANSGTSILQIANSTLSGNSASFAGGGIYNFAAGSSGSASVLIVNSTLSANSATLGVFGKGGGIYNYSFASGSVSAQIANSTLSDNSSASAGGGIYTQEDSGGNTSMEIGSTILKAGVSGANVVNVAGTVISLGYNLSSDAAGGLLTGPADQINTDPMLGPLQDNGGPTFTHALSVCSPAIDQGKNFSGSAADQRDAGFTRTFDDPGIADTVGGDGTDIGALEAQSPLLDTTPPTVTCPTDIVANATAPAGTEVSFAPTASDNCSLASVNCTPASGSTFAIGGTPVTCLATDGAGLLSSCAFSIYVKGAAEQIGDLIAAVQALPIDSGVKNGLVVKLQEALTALNAGQQRRACAKLQDFINLCNAQLNKRKLTFEQADYLITEATRIRAVIGC